MSMSFGLATTLSTSQKLTPQMQQAIKLLQLSSLELAQEVQLKLDSNPLLERVEDEDEGHDTSPELSDSLTLDDWNQDLGTGLSTVTADMAEHDEGFGDSFDKLQQANIDDTAIDIHTAEMDDYGGFNTIADRSSHVSTAALAGDRGEEDFDSYQGGTSATIQDYVRWQLNFKHLSATDMLIATYLIDAMDDTGFIRLDIEALLQSLNTMASFYQWQARIETEEVKAVLRIIQSCDPLGVGAQDLRECLAIQLSKLDGDTEYLTEAQMLLTASEHLVRNNIKALTEQTGLTTDKITPALMVLRRLHPSPGLLFQSRQPTHHSEPDSHDIPDVLVTPIRRRHSSSHIETDTPDDGWDVRLNPDILPKLRVNQEYASFVKRGDDSPDNQYLRENLTDARLFIRSIEERNQNLLKVATSIVRHQKDFLQHGATAMQPLILKVVAEEVDLHESTVSRLTTSKTMLTPQGLFPLKHFFSSHVSGNDGDVSSIAISAMIEQLIADENPKKPLSDSRIKDTLSASGIDIARRTVAKYREAMHIGSSTQRKQKY